MNANITAGRAKKVTRYKYDCINNNSGYSGDLEIALIPTDFLTDILEETVDDNGVLVESVNAELHRFALMFEFDGDKKKIRHVLYSCTASRPSIEGQTNTESKEVKTETLTLRAGALENGLVKAKSSELTEAATYNGWYAEVYMPEITPSSGGLSDPGNQGVTG